MGSILHSMGILAREHVEETSGKDLTGSFVGQTKDVVEKKMKAAAGGVLFIDEVSIVVADDMFTPCRVSAVTSPRFTFCLSPHRVFSVVALVCRADFGAGVRFGQRPVRRGGDDELLRLLTELAYANDKTIVIVAGTSRTWPR